MPNWKFNPEDYSEGGYSLIPEGRYRVRIEDAQEQISKSGKEMVKLTLKVSGYNSLVWYYLVFDSSDAEATKRTNDRLSSIYSSFQIPVGNMEIESWKGHTGGAKIRHRLDERNEQMRAEVHYFLYRRDVEKLPEWEDEKPEESTGDFNFGEENPESGEQSAETIPF